MVTGMCAENLRGPPLAELLHAGPEFHRSFGTVAALCHHHEANVVCFCFVLAGCGHAEEEVEEHFGRVEGDIEEGEGEGEEED